MEIKEEYHNYIHIYTDGSLSKIDDESGAAYFVEQTGEDYLIPCNSTSSMDTELCAIHAALQYCISSKKTNFVIFTDSKSSLELLFNYKTNYYFHWTLPISESLQKIEKQNKIIKFQWVPSHIGIIGNEKADLLAKQASKLHPKPVEILPLSHTYHKVQQHNLAIWIEKWLTGSTGNTLRKIQKNPRDISSYHGLPRSI